MARATLGDVTAARVDGTDIPGLSGLLDRVTPSHVVLTTGEAMYASVADVARQVVSLVTDPALTGTVRTVDAGFSLIP